MYADLLTLSPAKDFTQGHIFLIDKPLGWTSYNVVGKVRYLFKRYLGYKKLKVGHAGTLDPLATGLLIICVGKATRHAAHLTAANKRYLATLHIGATTPSADLETPIDNHYSTHHITPTLLHQVAHSFLGEQLQVPPLFSAKRIDGHRAYNLARAGKDLALPPVPITIQALTILSANLPTLTLDITCSKGTYIRALARDFGQRLSSGAHLTALQRTASGEFTLQNAITLQDLEAYLACIAPQAKPKP